MIKKIGVTEEMTFRELMEYIIQNDVSGTFKGSNCQQFKVDKNGYFIFEGYFYGDGEVYKVDVVEEITEDTRFEQLIVIDTDRNMVKLEDVTIGDIVKNYNYKYTSKIYALIDGDLQLVWEGEE